MGTSGAPGRVQNLRALIVALAVVVGVVLAPQAAEAAACLANGAWYDNCVTSTSSYQISDLTTGIQNVLSYDCEPGNPYGIDGYFGTNTETAVESYQDHYSLQVDGIVGPQTWNMLGGELNDPYNDGSNYIFWEVDCSGSTDLFRWSYGTANWATWSIRTTPDQWVFMDATRS